MQSYLNKDKLNFIVRWSLYMFFVDVSCYPNEARDIYLTMFQLPQISIIIIYNRYRNIIFTQLLLLLFSIQ